MSVCETSRYGSWQVKLSSTSWDRLAWSVCEYTVHASRSTTASCAQLVQHDGISICIGTDRPTDGRTDGRIEESDSSSALSWSVVTDASAKTWTSSAPPASVEFTGDRGGRAPLTVTHTSARRLPAVIYRVAGDRQQDSSSLWVHCLSFHTLIASLSAQLPRLLTGH